MTDDFLYHPFGREEALRRGYHWQDEEERELSKKLHLPPDDVSEVNDSLVKVTFTCSESRKAFKFIPQEVTFHRNSGLAFSELSPDIRYEKRFARRPPRELWMRQCAKTGKQVLSPYSSERPETLYSEKAYLEEVF